MLDEIKLGGPKDVSVVRYTQAPLGQFIKEHNIDPAFQNLVENLLLVSRFFVEDKIWIAGGCFGRLMRGAKLQDFHTDLEIVPEIFSPDSPYGNWKTNLKGKEYLVGDIDIFFQRREDIEKFVEYLKKYNELFPKTNFKRTYSPYAETMILSLSDNLKVKTQMIHCDVYTTVEELLENFDLSCCMFATNGTDVIFEETHSVKDTKFKILRFNQKKLYNHVTKGNANIAMRRIEKYFKQGFTIDTNNMSTFITYVQSLPKYDKNLTEQYNWIG